MSNVTLVLFDIGGVLIEYPDVFKTAVREQNIPYEFLDETYNKYENEITIGKITPKELYEICIRDYKLKADLNYNFVESWVRDYSSIKPTYDFIPVLVSKYKIGLFSNICKDLVPEMKKQNFIPKIKFDYEFLSCDLGMKKPDSNIYDYIQNTVNTEPNKILFIDDREDFIEPAIKKGWQTYKFLRKTPDKAIEELSKILTI